ncbi:MAG: hypothetical protein HYW57_10255 [Ignavibacteriales bacterium]|nr:hypothetical protein [Ignavibacteriales bacterium]
MKRHFLLSLAGLLAVGILLSGCQSATEPIEDELAVLKEMIESDPLFNSDQMLLDDPEAATLGKTTAPIIPVAWGRRVTSASRTIDFEREGDTIVVATIMHTISGEIKIAAKDSLRDTTITIVSKPFTETTVRKVKLTRIDRTDRPRDNWRIREVSAVAGGTGDAVLTVNQLMAVVGLDTLVVTDPLEFFLKLPEFSGRHMPSVGQNAPVKVQFTVTSTESDTDLVFLHRPAQWLNSSTFRPARVRLTLVSQTGSGPYTRVYEHTWNSHISGRHHFFVSAITRNSLFDDAAPWATKMWGIPYLVQ